MVNQHIYLKRLSRVSQMIVNFEVLNLIDH